MTAFTSEAPFRRRTSANGIQVNDSRGVSPAVTIYDIAKAADVSPSTVSRALGRTRLSEETRQHVENVAAELGYRAKHSGKSRPSDRPRVVGLIAGDLADPACFDIIRGVHATAGDHGYTLILAGTAELSGGETATALDGFILIDPAGDAEGIRALARQKPVVLINREIEGIASVAPDIKNGIRGAIRSLRSDGHQKVAFIAGPQEAWISLRAWEEVQFACQWPRLEPMLIKSTGPTVEGGRRVAREVLASGATAVLAYNDLLAIGLLGELQAASVTAPDQISIIGFGDSAGAKFTTPSLSTVRTHGGQSGARAVGVIKQMIEGMPPLSLASTVETEFVIRGSTGPRRLGRG